MQIFANYLAASKWLWISIAWIGRLDVGNALCGESTGHCHQWIQCQRTSFADLLCFVSIVSVDNIMNKQSNCRWFWDVLRLMWRHQNGLHETGLCWSRTNQWGGYFQWWLNEYARILGSLVLRVYMDIQVERLTNLWIIRCTIPFVRREENSPKLRVTSINKYEIQ